MDGMAVGLGTGSTVAYLLGVLGERAGELRRARCVATSPATARIARDLGLHVVELDDMGGALDLAIDGADQVDPQCWLVKGGGGAHTREKIVAAAARRFVVIVSAEKQVASLHPPVPLELLRFGAAHTLAAIGNARLRMDDGEGAAGDLPAGAGSGAPTSAGAGDRGGGDRPKEARAATTTDRRQEVMVSPDGNLLAWYDGPVNDVRELAMRLSDAPGVVEHGLFAPEMVSEVLIAGADGVRSRAGGKPAA
jgi:ribose 5-phosphate isomerase A